MRYKTLTFVALGALALIAWPLAFDVADLDLTQKTVLAKAGGNGGGQGGGNGGGNGNAGGNGNGNGAAAAAGPGVAGDGDDSSANGVGHGKSASHASGKSNGISGVGKSKQDKSENKNGAYSLAAHPSMLGRLNAAHANARALAAVSKNPVAAERSVIGLLATYKANVEAAIAAENEEDMEAEEGEEVVDPVAAAAAALAAAANKSINNNRSVVEAVNDLMGITDLNEETAQDIADQATATQNGEGEEAP